MALFCSLAFILPNLAFYAIDQTLQLVLPCRAPALQNLSYLGAEMDVCSFLESQLGREEKGV